jgi:hypothetical protein
MKRPVGFTILACLFAWLGVAGFAYVVAAPQVPEPQLRSFGLNVQTMVAVGVLYGASALAASIGFWKQARWTPRAVLCWGAALLLGMASFQFMIGIAGEPWWLVALPHFAFAAIAFSIFRYVDAKVRATHQAT